MASNEAAAVVAALTADMVGDAGAPVSQGELAAEESLARQFVRPEAARQERRSVPDSRGTAALASEVRDLDLPTREYVSWAEQHVAASDHGAIEARTRQLLAPSDTREARDRRLLRAPALEVPVQTPQAQPAPQAPTEQQTVQPPADRFVESLSAEQADALEQALLDRRTAEWQADAEAGLADVSDGESDYGFDWSAEDEAV